LNMRLASTGPRLSVSTWSLHRALGRPASYGPDRGLQIPAATHSRGALTLLEVPARIAAFGIHTLEICHFHLPSRDRSYLDEIRDALRSVGVTLFSLLIDEGDITDPIHAGRDRAWIGGWIETAAALGAERVRVIAGKSPPAAESLDLSRQGLLALAQQAQAHGVRLMTENWLPLLSHPQVVCTLLEQLNGEVGLCLDFGNWSGTTKYADLAVIAPYAESCHAKAHFSAPQNMERADYVRCLDLMRDADFAGPYTLIYDGPDDDEWAGLALEQAVVREYLSAIL